MSVDIEKIDSQIKSDLAGVSDETGLTNLKVKYLGRSGVLTQILRNIKSLPSSERPRVGKKANELRRSLESELSKRSKQLQSAKREEAIRSGGIDLSLPGRRPHIGKYHPLKTTHDEIVSIFNGLGFTVEDGPEVETDYYNFEALNFPKDHPARDMQDTFYLEHDLILRTHTSPVQIRTMERKKPPLRMICPGKAYRTDNDMTHTPMFSQVEGLAVDETISFADLKGVLSIFCRAYFGKDTKVRFRPSFFPFTEPSAEIDIGCVLCKGKGCRVCKETGWIEILGAGMVNPNVFKYVGYDSEKYQGFAFGMGIERVAMLKYGINDIRLFFENDVRFLSQF